MAKHVSESGTRLMARQPYRPIVDANGDTIYQYECTVCWEQFGALSGESTDCPFYDKAEHRDALELEDA
jgi:hypothetical protein